ncbi:MAG: GtrA family protein [Solirubrobacteraceae bacterium]
MPRRLTRAVRQLVEILRGPPVAHPLNQVVRYGIVVGCGYLLAIALYSGELRIGIPPYAGLGIAFVANGLFNFALVRVWAFPPSGRGLRSDFGRFCTVAAGSFGVNYASFAVLYSGLTVGAATSQRLAIIIAAPVTFLANRLWSFQANGSIPGPHTASESRPTSARNESYSRM